MRSRIARLIGARPVFVAGFGFSVLILGVWVAYYASPTWHTTVVLFFGTGEFKYISLPTGLLVAMLVFSIANILPDILGWAGIELASGLVNLTPGQRFCLFLILNLVLCGLWWAALQWLWGAARRGMSRRRAMLGRA